MGPKKKQTPNKLGAAPKKTRNKPDAAVKKKTSKKPNSSSATKRITQTNEDSGKENDSDFVSGNLQSQASQLLLGRKNRLNDLLASSQTSHTEAPKPGPKGKKTGSRSNGKFEEDDGFVYKRDQDKDDRRKRKPANPLISQLREETDQISQSDEDFSHIHLEEPIVKKARKQPKKTVKSVGNKPKAVAKSNGLINKQSTSRIPFPDDSSLQLSSPIKSPNYAKFYNGYSSDEYVEQVSHLKVNLSGTEPTKRNQKKAPNTKNKRRASYHNRGKRVLSIGNGFVGAPHEDVPTSDYYKLLDTSLPEPHRMRQLLIWCLKKKLDDEEKQSRDKSTAKTTEDQTVINIAKVIKEEVLRDLIDGQISISWYNRDDYDNEHDNILTSKEVTLPNPLNITNEENIEVFTKKLKSLKHERSEWETSFNRSTSHIPNLQINADQDETMLKEYCTTRDAENTSVDFNSTVLDQSLVNKISDNYKEVSRMPQNVESSIDRLYDTSYRLSRAHDLVARLQNDTLKQKTSSLVQNYMTKHLRDDDSLKNSSWPIPSRKISTKELLRGITRLDDPSVSL